MTTQMHDFEEYPPAMAWQLVLLMLLAAAVGAIGAVFILPVWLPGLTASLFGEAPKAYWYLARSSGVVAYILLWLSMVFGVMMTNKLARLWPGGPTAFDAHQFTSLLGLAFALFHAIILLGDEYIQSGVANVLVPFTYDYRPEWVGVGQLAFYAMAIIAFSFYVRQTIGRRAWRLIHYLSFLTYLAALAHGIVAGTDAFTPFMQALYWGTGGIFLFLTIYRIQYSIIAKRERAAKQAAHRKRTLKQTQAS